MAIKCQLCDGLLHTTLQGRITTEDFRQALEINRDIETRLEITPDRITDLSAADASGLNTSQVMDIAIARRQARLKNKVKSAFVAPKPEQFGLARVFQTYNDNPAIEIMVFKDAASAYKWLGREAKDGGET